MEQTMAVSILLNVAVILCCIGLLLSWFNNHSRSSGALPVAPDSDILPPDDPKPDQLVAISLALQAASERARLEDELADFRNRVQLAVSISGMVRDERRGVSAPDDIRDMARKAVNQATGKDW